jgi:Tol biopolymer transport system component
MKTTTLLKLATLFLVLQISTGRPCFSQESEKLFQKGLVKEEGEGSLQEAIDIFSKVAEDASAERSFRAKALLHVGICYEKLGQEKAKNAYKKLIADFADQEAIVAIGKKKLSVLLAGDSPSPHPGVIAKEIWSPAGDTYDVSPDGRYLTFIDWNAINISVKDIKTGEEWRVTKNGTWEPPIQFPDNSEWSPDGNQIAYYWFVGEKTELRIVNRDGTGDRLVCDGIGDETPWPVTWSPDGKHIFAIKMVKDTTKPLGHYDQILKVSVADGSVHVLKTFDKLHTNGQWSISPDGRFIAYDLQQEIGSRQKDIYLLTTDGSTNERIVADPANDINPLWKSDGSGIVFLSNRMGTQDIWSLQLENGKSQGKPEIVKSNLGDRSQLLGITNGGSLYYNYNNARSDIFLTTLDFNTGEIIAEPKMISPIDQFRNVRPSWSPDGRYAAYYTITQDRDRELGWRYRFIVHDTETGTDHKVLTNVYGGWEGFGRQNNWTSDGKSILLGGSTKDRMQGFYLVDIETGKEKPVCVKEMGPQREPIFPGINPVFSMDRTSIYYLEYGRKAIIKRSVGNNTEKRIVSGEDEIHHFKVSPDEQHVILVYWFKDRNKMFKIPFEGGDVTQLVELPENIIPYIISWTKDGKYVIFDARTSDRPNAHKIMRVPVTGGEPEHILSSNELFGNGSVVKVEIHPDGKQALYVLESGYDSGVWALENLFKQ